MKPRLLDLFCGAGGAAMGYHRAGFDVVGVDNRPQPNYPFEFYEADALGFLSTHAMVKRFDAIHASPPCPRYSRITSVHGKRDNHPDLVLPTRALLQQTGVPYIIENVPGAPLENYTVLCGEALNLGANCKDGKWRPLKRHRLFETTFLIWSGGCACSGREPIGVYGHGGAQSATVRNGGHLRGYMGTVAECSEALGIGWMTKPELANAIPPAYTELIGHQLLQHLRAGGQDAPHTHKTGKAQA